METADQRTEVRVVEAETTEMMRCIQSYMKASCRTQIREGTTFPADDPVVLTSPGFWAPLDASENEIRKLRERVLSR